MTEARDADPNTPSQLTMPTPPALELVLEFVRQAPFLPGPGVVALAAASSAVEPWPHQMEVAYKAVARYPQGFLFCDEVGLGKTVEAGLALRSLWISKRVRRALLLVPAALLRQWHEELHEKFALPVARFDGEHFVDVFGREVRSPADGDGNLWNGPRLVLASSQLARRSERRQELLAAEPWDLVLVDEAHHARRRNPSAEGYRPNRLLELLAGRTARYAAGDETDGRGLMHRSRCVWLLTATPMQIHPTELWDLLGLVGAPVPGEVRETEEETEEETENWRHQVFRHTREVLRRYRSEGLLDAEVPTRRPENVWIELGHEAREVYRRIERYLSLFYRRYEAERRGLGFVMTVYRRRLTSSFEAIRRSLIRRRGKLAAGGPAGEIEDAEGPGLSPGLFDAASGADELTHLESFLGDLAKLDADPKVEQLRADLRRLLAERDRVLVFTQYLDTLDHLRDVLSEEWTVACWSGRGSEVWIDGAWVDRGKEELKAAFGAGKIQVLLATDAASEGLNLQSCGVLINFDMPWNPMRVEQRIGRVDRIGQRHSEVWVRSYFYADTVEAEVYRRLADRIRWFEDVVGTLQPILQQVGEAVGEVAMLPPERRKRPLEERMLALRRSVDESRSAPQVDLASPSAPPETGPVDVVVEEPCVSPDDVENVVLALAGDIFQPDENPGISGIYRLLVGGHIHRVTFRPEIYDAHPYSTRFLTWGEPLFERLLEDVQERLATKDEAEFDERNAWSSDEPGGIGVYRSERPAPVTLFLHPGGEARTLDELGRLAASAPATWSPGQEAEAASRFSALRRRALEVRESIESERRRTERGDLHHAADRLLVRLALLELLEAENPGLFDRLLPWGFGARAVREQSRHGAPLSGLVERRSGAGGLPAAQSDDPFYLEARGHRRGWRERRRRALLAQAEDCLLRLRALDAAEAEARLRIDEPSAGMLSRRWFHLGSRTVGPALLEAPHVDPFVSALPALGTLDEATSRLLDAAEEGWDLLSEIRRRPEAESWIEAEGRAGARRFAAQAPDDAMAPRVPNASWCIFEMLAGRPPQPGELVLARVHGESLIRRYHGRGSALVLEAETPGQTVVIEEPDPESVQVLARFVGRL